ncbi:MAG: hypothetical protein GY737_15845 [Desulfobacteraceae bacterium]|nr:hypothetical protein [Desulfobacteraceae bacterium]
MPAITKLNSVFIILIALLLAQPLVTAASGASQGIGIYYLRYDIKSSNNRVVDTKLLMVPADNDFRAENFTTIATRGSVTAVPGDSTRERLDRAKENALKLLLEEKGLKSVSTASSVFSGKTAGIDTVVSYEGAVIPPMETLSTAYDPRTQCFSAVFNARFTPLAFPDRWKLLHFKTKIKQALQGFISLF